VHTEQVAAPPTQPLDHQRLREYLERGGAAPKRVRGRLRELSTAVLKPVAQRQLAKLRERPELRLHLGSGFLPKEGWIDVDLAGVRVDLVWNLKHGIPFGDDTVDAVFHEHLLEHLSLRDGFQLTRDCRRALKPGGVLRVAVPNAGDCLRSYAGVDDPDWARSRPTPMLSVQALFYEHGHRAMYDEQLLVAVLTAAGFEEVAGRAFGDSRLSPCPDSEARRDGTLYVEGVKPPTSSAAREARLPSRAEASSRAAEAAIRTPG
jgi:predicted SAM-dependent methyltransferase